MEILQECSVLTDGHECVCLKGRGAFELQESGDLKGFIMAAKAPVQTKAAPEVVEQKSLINRAAAVGMAAYRNSKTILVVVLFAAALGSAFWYGTDVGANGVLADQAAVAEAAVAEQVMLADAEAARVASLPWYNFWD